MGAIAFSKNRNASLIASLRGELYFACRANKHLWALESRVGDSVSYTTALGVMRRNGQRRMDAVRKLFAATSLSEGLIIRFDNIQKYRKPRFTRIGRSAAMMTGTASTAFAMEGLQDDALSIENRRKCIQESTRKDLTLDDVSNAPLHSVCTDHIQVYASIDHDYLQSALRLQWLRILLAHVPELGNAYMDQFRRLEATVLAQKHKQALRRTQTYTLPTTGYEETTISELVKCLRTILANAGLEKETYVPKLCIVGGDGLSFERTGQLINYLQFEEHEFDRLEFLLAILEPWHESWTELDRVFEANWGSLASEDPSTIGHGVNVLNGKAPSSLKKLDYYKYIDVLYQQLDARVLDCWR